MYTHTHTHTPQVTNCYFHDHGQKNSPKPHPNLPAHQLVTLILSFFSLVTADNNNNNNNNKEYHFSKIRSPKKLGLKREKLSHLRFYFHDIVSGKKPTAVPVAAANTTSSSPTGFGLVEVIDDPLTMGAELTSKQVGRAQGIYASVSQTEMGLLMVQNYVLTEGKYNGSTLSVLGRNTVFAVVRELPIVGGSGLFRFARGYAQARTHTFNHTSLNAIVEYNVYLFN